MSDSNPSSRNRMVMLLIGGIPLTIILVATWLWFFVVRGDLDLIGIVGTAVGLCALSWALKRPTFNPISPLGFFAAVGGAFVLVILYRFAALRWLGDGEERSH